MSEKKTILVTGGAGYVGSTLVPMLLAKGYKVRVLDNLFVGGNAIIQYFASKDFEFIKGDIADPEVVKKASKDIDYVIHLAAIVGYPSCRKYPEISQKTNVVGTQVLCDIIDKKIPFIFPSTGSTYGKLINDLCTETTPLNPLTSYGKQKAEAEEIIKKRGNYVIYRYATAYGVSPRMRLDLLPNDFAYKAVKEKTLIVYEKNFMRTFVHVADMARSLLFAVENFDRLKDEIYNVGDESQNLSKEAVCNILRKHADFYLHFADVGKDFDQRDYMVSYEKIKKAGFRTTIDIEEGVVQLIRAMDAIEIKSQYSNV